MNIFLITQNEPFYIPKIIQRIYYELNREDKIVGITLLKPYHKSKNYLTWIQERAIVYTLRELILLIVLFSYVNLYELSSRVLPLTNLFSVRRLCLVKNIRLIETDDINSAEYLARIRTLDIDIIISLSATQIFKKPLIDVPKRECVNVHGTLLPRHRGVMGSWWALAAGDTYTGVTVHRLIEKLDAGEIILQEKILIEKDDTQFSLATKTKKISAELLLKMLDQLKRSEIKLVTIDVNTGNINTFPTKEQAIQFRKGKKGIITFKDLKDVIRTW